MLYGLFIRILLYDRVFITEIQHVVPKYTNKIVCKLLCLYLSTLCVFGVVVVILVIIIYCYIVVILLSLSLLLSLSIYCCYIVVSVCSFLFEINQHPEGYRCAVYGATKLQQFDTDTDIDTMNISILYELFCGFRRYGIDVLDCGGHRAPQHHPPCTQIQNRYECSFYSIDAVILYIFNLRIEQNDYGGKVPPTPPPHAPHLFGLSIYCLLIFGYKAEQIDGNFVLVKTTIQSRNWNFYPKSTQNLLIVPCGAFAPQGSLICIARVNLKTLLNSKSHTRFQIPSRKLAKSQR